MTYHERRVPCAGATAWSKVADGTATWVLPDGCMDVIWTGQALVIAGPDTGPRFVPSAPGTAYTALRFDPGTGPMALGLAADAARDLTVPLNSVWSSSDVAQLEDALAAAAVPEAVLVTAATRRLRSVPAEPWRGRAATLLAHGASVADVADALGWTDRQLHRRSLTAFGYGPKVLARILRLQRVLPLARSGIPFALAAAEAGYADQAHLSREVRALAGASLGDLVRPAPRPQAGPSRVAKRSTPLPSGSRRHA